MLPRPPATRSSAALDAAGVPAAPVPVGGAVRTNLTITEPDGTTTKLNEPGALLDGPAADRADRRGASSAAATASWVVLSGSLPPGVPDDWYADMVARAAGRWLPGRRRHLRAPAVGAGRRVRPAPRPT